MIFKSRFPNSPNVDVLISGVSVDYTAIQSVDIDFEENRHDMAVITFVGLPPKAITDYVNAPVQISIETSPSQSAKFYGYVSYVEPEMITRRGLVNNSPVQQARVVCFGKSMELIEKKSKIWENISLPELVKNIAEQYGFSYAVPADYFVWTRLLQNDKSNWQLLVETCNALGYFITAHGTHLHVYDPYRIVSRQLPYVELKTVRGLKGALGYGPGQVLEFKGTFGEYTPDGHAGTYTYMGIDNTGNMISTDSLDDLEMYSGLGEQVPSNYVDTVSIDATSLEMLKRFASAAMRHRYPYNATVSVTGIPDPVPGSVAKVNNYNAAFDGYWLVRGVKHRLSRSNYITELSISTDSTNESRPPIKPVGAFKTPPESALSSANRWVATYSMEDVYAR